MMSINCKYRTSNVEVKLLTERACIVQSVSYIVVHCVSKKSM